MSTRARIAIALPNGYYRSIYSHWNGHPDYLGRMLVEHYSSDERIRALIALGSICCLAPRLAPYDGETHSFEQPAPGVTVAYGRDRGETDTEAALSKSLRTLIRRAHQCWAEYLYLWQDGVWRYCKLDDLDKFNWPNDESTLTKLTCASH